jgi:hypothetical protein
VSVREDNINRYVKREKEFLKNIPSFSLELCSNTDEDRFALDFKLVRKIDGLLDSVVALVDLEIREGYDLCQFNTIHVPLYDYVDGRKVLRKKIETYRRFYYKSFHLVWQPEYNRGFIIQAYDIISASVVEHIVSKNTGRVLDVYDVPVDKCVRVTKEQIIPIIMKKLLEEV